MSDHNRSHWAHDQDLLEQYVAGQIPVMQRMSLETHLKTCDDCRARVADERLISEGIRAEGRSDLRKDLANRLSRRRTPDTAGVWRWMAAAAMLVAVVGVWRWLTPTTITTGETPTLSERPRVERAENGRPASSVPPRESSTSRSDRAPRRERTEIRIAESAEPSAAQGAGAGIVKPEGEREVMADAVAPTAEEKLEPTPKSRSADSPSVWVQAVIVQHAGVESRTELRSQFDARSKPTGKQAQAVGLSSVQHGPMGVQLRQSPRVELPRDQRILAEALSATQIPALITSTGDSLLIELFPKLPFPESEIASATILRPETDSVVVRIGLQYVGIRIPQGMLVK